jgi:hypothetical protein
MSYGFPPVPVAWHLWCALALASALVAAFVALLAYVVAD